MAFSLTAVTPETISENGGYLLTITGSFEVGHTYLAFLTSGSNYGCHSGVAGQGNTLFLQLDGSLRCYSPMVDPNTSFTLTVKDADTLETHQLVNAVDTINRDFHTSVFKLRKVLPINWAAGPRTVESDTEVALVGFLEACTEAIGKQDNEIGGFNITKLTSLVNAGVTTFPVETTLNWPDTGSIGVDGIKYYYSGKTLKTFTGITHLAKGVTVNGAAIQHRDTSPVVDVSLVRSGVELLRRSLLIDYAEGEDLNALARNLGVDRLPIFDDDDHFRAVAKALAYNPKGTILGLTLALDAILGSGNYVIYEDLLQFPNTVFIRIAGSAISETESQGKTFMGSTEWLPLSGSQNTLTVSAEPISVTSIQLYNLGELFDFRTNLPSGVTYDYYPGVGSPGNAWTYAGANSEIAPYVTQSVGSHVSLYTGGNTTFYRMLDTQGARIQPESEVIISSLLMIPSGATVDPTNRDQAAIYIFDGAKSVAIGVLSGLVIGLFDPAGSGFLGSTFSASTNQWYEVTLKKYGETIVELWIDGNFITRINYSQITSSTSLHQIEFGCKAGVASMTINFRQIGASIRTTTDYWNARGSAGSVAAANPTRFNDGVGGGLLAVGDVGKRLIIRGSSIANFYNGNNNGVFVIDSFVSSGIVELVGESKTGASVDSANPLRITLENEDFVYPDDLGKKITISGSSAGNDGTYIIDVLYNPGTTNSLYNFYTTVRTKTNVCDVVSASFNSEVNLNWNLEPVFDTEANLEWELADASSFSGTAVTLRQSLWKNDLLMQIFLTRSLSAQVLPESIILNTLVSDTPLVFEYWPFYLSDPLGLLRAYLEDLTVAGVIPEFIIE